MFWQKLFTPKTKLVPVGETNNATLIKRILFIFALLAVTFGLSALVFSGGKNLLALAWLSLVAAVFMSVFLILTLVFSAGVAFLLGLITVIVILAPFFSVLTLFQQLLFVGLGFIMLFFAGLRATARTENSIQFSAAEAMRAGRGFLILFLTLLLSLSAGAGLLNAREFPVTEENVYGFFRPSEPVVQKFYPGFSYRMTLEEFFQLVFAKQTQGLDLESMLPAELNNAAGAEFFQNLGLDFSSVGGGIEEQARLSFFAQASALVGREVKPGETFSGIFLSYLQDKYDSLPVDARNFFGGAIFLILFLLIWGTLGFLAFLLNIIFWLVFGLFRLTGLVRITTITVEKEVLSL